MSYQKNIAGQKFNVLAISTATGLPITGDAANITAKISKDSGAFASVADTNPTELDATNAAGVYVFDLSQAETNGNVLTIVPVSTTANVQIDMLNIYTSAVKAQLDDIEDVVGDIDVATTTIESKTANLTFTIPNQVDANSLTGGTSPSAVADAVWDAQTSDHAIPGSTGEAVASAASEVSVILPATGTVPKRNQGETIQVYNQEEITVAVAVFDLAGNPVDLSTTGLWFGVWDRSKNMVTTATPIGTATGFTVVVPKLDRLGSGLTWVVRDSSATGQVILTGPFDIISRPYQ